MILIPSSEKDLEKRVVEIPSWNSEFTETFLRRMKQYHWTSCTKDHNKYLQCPLSSLDWFILIKSGDRFLFNKNLFNPIYEIYYKGYLILTVKPVVYKWETSYTFSLENNVVEDNIATVDNLVELRENVRSIPEAMWDLISEYAINNV